MQIVDRLPAPRGELYPCCPMLWLTKARLVPSSSECFTGQRNNQTIQKVADSNYPDTPCNRAGGLGQLSVLYASTETEGFINLYRP